MRLLATADLHLGRRPSRIPDADSARYSAAWAWQEVVDCAVREGVDAVLLAGDVIDGANRYFEALGPFEEGLRRLAEHRIPTFAVAGNHDWAVLPRVASTVGSETLCLLGAGGVWESRELPGADGEAHCFGWSFPGPEVSASPLADFPAEAVDPSQPVIGLLHADLDVPVSPYAPVRGAEFQVTNVGFWVLGHVHRPGVHSAEGGARLLYPGSPQGLDPGPGETGAHGPWLLEWGRDGWDARQIPTAAIRYETVQIDLAGCAAAGDLQQRVASALREQAVMLARQQPVLQRLCVRLELAGVCALGHRQCEAALAELLEGGMSTPACEITVDDVAVTTTPPRDLEKLAGAAGPLAEVAALLLELTGARPVGKPTAAMLEDAGAAVEAIRRDRVYTMLDDGEEQPASARQLVTGEAWRLLEELLAQENADG